MDAIERLRSRERKRERDRRTLPKGKQSIILWTKLSLALVCAHKDKSLPSLGLMLMLTAVNLHSLMAHFFKNKSLSFLFVYRNYFIADVGERFVTCSRNRFIKSALPCCLKILRCRCNFGFREIIGLRNLISAKRSPCGSSCRAIPWRTSSINSSSRRNLTPQSERQSRQ